MVSDHDSCPLSWNMCELAAYYLIIDTKNIQGKAQKRLSITACWTLSIELIETFQSCCPFR
ncbi:Uncharacterised protein [Vibrio cholerae]|uniref:Uncharacterized protein n=1 Tax=Vibrio cholerae TaxID=666 RepID=A0A656AR49_VIBCL|nr:Uncharacterised protein [Vibrio cholerae]CSA49212.1 Uncharacterised protein [Vibrio cholerae]CSA70719.1 Uncharacterised protein [Vibrio cholerae]CSA76120.1 Uncharacterised protein [Vibrio cholerae]CSD28844.1 Uncharacterised protein [Vibrio cholerae]